MITSISKKALKTIAAILAAISLVVSLVWNPPGASWLGTLFVSALMVFFFGSIATFFGSFAVGLWNASRPKQLYVARWERWLVRFGKFVLVIALLAGASCLAFTSTRRFHSSIGFILVLVAMILLPIVYLGIKQRIYRNGLIHQPPPTKIKVLYIPFDHESVVGLPAFEGFCEFRRNPLEIAASNPADVSAWHFPFPDFELYEAFRNQMTRGDKQLLSLERLTEFSDRQAKRLKERASRTDVPCVLIESDSAALIKTIFAQTTNEGYFDDLEIFDHKIEKVILELRAQLPADHYLLISYGFRWPLTIIANWTMLMQLREQQHSLAREVREVLVNFVDPGPTQNTSEDA